jgi:glycosyltransferase involved in cell wall biosynthesis
MRILNNNIFSYNEVRSIILFGKNENIHYKKDVFDRLNKLKHKLTGISYTQFFKGFFFSFVDQKTPCHFFNTVNLGKNPWIVTFETTIPRLGNVKKIWFNMGIKQLPKANCKKIIALSQCAFDMQIRYLSTAFPQYVENIRKKMIVMHPPQVVLVNNYSEKNISENEICFTIIGSDFFRKGGKELLNVFKELIPLHPQIKLNIISSMEYGDYASQATKEDLDAAMAIIKSFHDNIRHYKRLPNAEVLEILKRSHIGLLPTWGDTYGYSVLEAQAEGCPVITTNLRALPEINNNDIGWMIEVPVNDRRDGDIDTFEKRVKFREVIESGLRKIILEIIKSPEVIREKGERCIEKIRSKHSPEIYKSQLELLYKENF